MYTYTDSVPLVHYMPLVDENDLVNLMDSLSDVPLAKKSEEKKDYLPHWKGSIDINLVHDTNRYPLG